MPYNSVTISQSERVISAINTCHIIIGIYYHLFAPAGFSYMYKRKAVLVEPVRVFNLKISTAGAFAVPFTAVINHTRPSAQKRLDKT